MNWGLLTSAQSLNAAVLKEYAQTSCKLFKAGIKKQNQRYLKAWESPQLPDPGTQAALLELQCWIPLWFSNSSFILSSLLDCNYLSLVFLAQGMQPVLYPLTNLAVQQAKRAPAAGTVVATVPGSAQKSKPSGGIYKALLAFKTVSCLTLWSSLLVNPRHKMQAPFWGGLLHRPRLGLIFNLQSKEAERITEPFPLGRRFLTDTAGLLLELNYQVKPW